MQTPFTTPIDAEKRVGRSITGTNGSTTPSLVRQRMDDPELYRQVCEEARQRAQPASSDQPWRGPPGPHLCLEPDGEVRWVPDTPHHERQRALGKTLMAQGMPDEAIETILWMDNERHLRDSDADAEPVGPVKRTRQRKPTPVRFARPASPSTHAPRLICREDAAAYASVSPNTFDRLVVDGLMPAPLRLTGRRIAWDLRQLDAAIDRMSIDGDAENDPDATDHSWDDIDAQAKTGTAVR